MPKHLRFRLSGGLGPAELERIHQQVLKVLANIGIEVTHERWRSAAAAHPGVREAGARLCFAPQLVEEFAKQARREHHAEPLSDEVTISGPWNCLNIVDLETDEIRPSTLADAREMLKLVHAARAGHICPVYPNDAPPGLQILALEKAAIELTEGNGSQLECSDYGTLESIIAMYAAAGRRYHIEVQFPISPLKTNPAGLETIWRYMDRTDVVVTAAAAPIPQAGSTAPLFLPGGLVQAAAEALGSYILVRLVAGDRVNCHPQYRLDLFDLKTTVTVYSSPMHILYQLCLKDVYEFYYRAPKPGHFVNCLAKTCDAQAVLERTSYMLTLALAGMRRFCLGAGQLSLDEVFCPVTFIVDQEIARFITRIIRGVGYDERPDAAYEAIARGVAEGHYLMHESTLANMRQDFDSCIFPRLSLGTWKAAGRPSFEQRAKERVRALIESHDFRLADNVMDEVERIYNKAVERVRSSPP